MFCAFISLPPQNKCTNHILQIWSQFPKMRQCSSLGLFSQIWGQREGNSAESEAEAEILNVTAPCTHSVAGVSCVQKTRPHLCRSLVSGHYQKNPWRPSPSWSLFLQRFSRPMLRPGIKTFGRAGFCRPINDQQWHWHWQWQWNVLPYCCPKQHSNNNDCDAETSPLPY